MGFKLAIQEIRKPRADFVERQDFGGRLEFSGGLGHTIDRGGFCVLRNRMMAHTVDELEAFRAVAPHPGEEGGNHVPLQKWATLLKKTSTEGL